jgi:hypothetical protein
MLLRDPREPGGSGCPQKVDLIRVPGKPASLLFFPPFLPGFAILPSLKLV